MLTAALRRPGRTVREVVAETWRDPDGRAGLVDAARELGWVLRHRRRLPARVEADLVALSRWEPDTAPATVPLASTVG